MRALLACAMVLGVGATAAAQWPGPPGIRLDGDLIAAIRHYEARCNLLTPEQHGQLAGRLGTPLFERSPRGRNAAEIEQRGKALADRLACDSTAGHLLLGTLFDVPLPR